MTMKMKKVSMAGLEKESMVWFQENFRNFDLSLYLENMKSLVQFGFKNSI